jgi:hypothetical protein
MRSECLLQRFRPYLAPKSPSRPPEAQIEEELVVLNARPRWTVGSAIGKFTTQNPAVYHPQADKISISLPGPLPVRSSFAGNHSTIRPSEHRTASASVEGLQGAALRTRGGAGARLQAGARVCNQCLATRRGRLKSLAARLQARLASCPRPQRPVSRGLPSRSRVCNSWPMRAQDSGPHRALRAFSSNINIGFIYCPTWCRDSRRSASCSGQPHHGPF